MGLRNTILLVVLAITAGLAFLWHHSASREYQVSFAAGHRSTPIYAFASALKLTVENHYRNISINLYETQGSMQNARLLSDGAVDVAITELELISGSDIRFISQIFPATYHLVVQVDSGIEKIADLQGMRVSVPPLDSEEYRLFAELLEHYGIADHNIYLFPGTYKAGEWLFRAGAVDAVFRIRAAGDEQIRKLLRETDGRLVEIDHADALKLNNPALEPAKVPAGAYSGNPPIPVTNLDTVALRRALLAGVRTDDVVVNALTSALFEYRRELTERVPLAGNISAPTQSEGISLPLHNGARQYFEREEPNFIQENAEPLALILSVVIGLASASVHFSNRANRKRMDGFNRQLVVLAEKARSANSFEELDKYDGHLGEFFGRIIEASEEGKVNAQEFSIFKFAFQATEDAIRDREFQLRREIGDDRQDPSPSDDNFRPRNRMTKVT